LGNERSTDPVTAPILVDIEIEGINIALGESDHVAVVRAWAEPDPVIAYQRRTRPRDEAQTPSFHPPSKDFAGALVTMADCDCRLVDLLGGSSTDLDARIGLQAFELFGKVFAENQGKFQAPERARYLSYQSATTPI
jgi:hypothetical protein